MKLTIRLLMLSLGLAMYLPAISVAEGEAYSEPMMSFEVSGIVTGFEPSFGTISIDGQEYYLAEGIKVQSLVSGNPMDSLKVGVEVGYVATENESGSSIIGELWVLSAPVVEPEDD